MNQQIKVYKVLRGVLAEEVERVAKVVGNALAANLEGTSSDIGGNAQPRQLTSAQSATFSRSQTIAKPRRSKVA
jgi:hypothetical protein